MFDIEFVADHPESHEVGGSEDQWLALRGCITIGNHREVFLAALGPWTRADYERQWIEGACRLLERADRTCFLTSAFRFMWVMHRSGEAVFVQEQMLLAEMIPVTPFDPNDPYAQIINRETVSEDGERISEWRLQLSDIRDFVTRRERHYGSPRSRTSEGY